MIALFLSFLFLGLLFCSETNFTNKIFLYHRGKKGEKAELKLNFLYQFKIVNSKDFSKLILRDNFISNKI